MINVRTPRALAARWLPPLAFLVLVCAVWQVYATAKQSLLLPTFTATMAALVAQIGQGTIWEPLARSNVTMIIGFLISVVIGVPLGFLMGRRSAIDRVSAPYIALMIVIPIAPLLPIVVMAIGFGLQAGVLVVVLFALVYITANARAGIRSVDPQLVEMARSYGANELETWRFVLIPNALPAIGTGLRIGLGRAFSGMLLGELLLFSSGIGLQMLDFRGRFLSADLFAVVIILLMEALLIGASMRWLERRLDRARTGRSASR